MEFGIDISEAERKRKQAEAHQRYKANSPEKYRARVARSNARHASAIRKWREDNRDHLAAKDAERDRLLRQARDPNFLANDRRKRATRRARELAQFVEAVDSLMVLERDDGACGICGTDVDPLRFEVDHIIPLSKGGEHSYANVQAAHPRCNRRKGAKV